MASELNGIGVYGRRLLPTVFDSIAKETPQRLYASVPVESDLSKGYRDITFGQMKSAVDSFAHYVKKSIGSSTSFEATCYLGEPDLRTALIFLAMVKCGFKVRS